MSAGICGDQTHPTGLNGMLVFPFNVILELQL